ncbi:MAG: DUF1559 domain-containing protein [Planctomyces sp.]|nr:DUF1559 domain-containing protein [Planctomyces sp.]
MLAKPAQSTKSMLSGYLGRRGMTLVESLVAIGIIGLIAAIAIPAVQSSRSSSRRLACGNQLRQLGLAAQNYESLHRCFPGALEPLAQLLPGLEGPDLSQLTDDEQRQVRFPQFACPADAVAGALGGQAPSYAMNGGVWGKATGWNGFFTHSLEPLPGVPSFQIDIFDCVRAADITDGLSNTAMFAERTVFDLRGHAAPVPDDPVTRLSHAALVIPGMRQPGQLDIFADQCERRSVWDPQMFSHFNSNLRGQQWYNHVLPPNRASCLNGNPLELGVLDYSAVTANSLHPGGVNCLAGDASVHFVGSGIDRRIWRGLGSRNGNESDTHF